MTGNQLILIMLAEAVGLVTLYSLLRRLAWFTKRTWDEVPEFLRHLDHESMLKLFDAQEEWEVLTFSNSRRTMRARLALSREYLKRMLHNATIVYQWAETEWSDMVRHALEYDDETRARILAVHRECITFMVAARFALIRMWFWSILHFDKLTILPVPSVAGMRKPGSLDLVAAYLLVKEAAAGLAGVYGEEQVEEIRSLM
jgi:hypothetical protein